MKIFYMNGAGNDFMVFDGRGLDLDFSALAKKLCALRHADGLLAVGNAEGFDFEMIFYNADGTRGEMCGNGARCICRFAYDQGLVGEQMRFKTLAGPVEGWRVDENQYRVALNLPTVLDLNRGLCGAGKPRCAPRRPSGGQGYPPKPGQPPGRAAEPAL
jgi:diaminopimelate epimerase